MLKLALIALFLLGGQSPQPSAQTLTEPICVCQPQAKSEPKDAVQSEPYWRKAFKPDILPVWIGGLAALLASGAGLRTLRDLKKQTRAALLAAQAAKTSADIAANSERSWLITDLIFFPVFSDLAKQGAPEKSKVLINVKNVGRCPAEIDRVQAVAFLFPTNEEFFTEPRYDENLNRLFEIVAAPGEIIAVGGERHMLCPITPVSILSSDDLTQIKDGVQRLYCYGKIDYKDISKVSRVTQFGYCYYTRKNSSDDRPPAMY